MSAAQVAPLAVLLAASVWYDLKTGRVPNWLTLGGAVAGLTLGALFGSASLINYFLGALIAGGVWFLLWRHGWMGGGDQKLMIASGAWLGLNLAPALIFFVAVAGGLQAAAVIAYNFFCRRSIIKKPWQKISFPYTIAISAGTLAVVLLHWGGMLPAWILLCAPAGGEPIELCANGLNGPEQ